MNLAIAGISFRNDARLQRKYLEMDSVNFEFLFVGHGIEHKKII